MFKTKWLALCLLIFVAACGTDTVGENDDAGTNFNPGDTGSATDFGNVPDLGEPTEDMGETAPDMDEPADMNSIADAGDAGEIDAGATDAGTSGADAGMCDQTGFSVTSSTVESIAADLFIYDAIEGVDTDPNYRRFELAIFPEDGGTIATQGFTFTGESYADCGLCLLAYACTANGCNRTFMAQSGSVDISAIGTGSGDAFAAEFSDIVFQEVQIDDGTFATTLVPGGDTWCVPTLSASGTNVAN